MKILSVAALAVLLVLPARAEEKPAQAKTGWSDFFKNLKNTLGQSAVGGERKKGRGATYVAAVRGDRQRNLADPNEPSLKGDYKSSKIKKEIAYDAELAASIELVSNGKLEEGLKGLEAFKVAHPKHRAEDVDKAIAGVKAMIAEASAPAPAAK